MILRLFLVLGALWGISGTILQVVFWREMPFSATLIFWLIGASIIVAVNRWWILADWNDELLMYFALACLFGALLATIYVVCKHIIHPTLLDKCLNDDL